jgi:hypothetical protein
VTERGQNNIDYFHLMQVNRQIGSEFRLLYLEDIHSGGNDVWMEDTELVPYLNAFFPGWDVLGVDKSGLLPASYLKFTMIGPIMAWSCYSSSAS